MRQSEPLFRDTLFRGKQKRGGYQVVDPPQPALEALVADTHAHLEMLADVPLALARCAAHGLGFLCCVVDVCEGDLVVYDRAEAWRTEAQGLLGEILGDRGPCHTGPYNVSQEGDKGTGRLSHFDTFGDKYVFQNVTNTPSPCHPPIPSIRVAAGCHPHHARHYSKDAQARLLDCASNHLTCAIGEVGLDFHYDFSPREAQREAFRRQVGVAHATGLPLILHLREAHEEALAIMDEEGFPEAGTLLHCFNLGADVLAPWVERGCYIAFGGPLTFKKSDDVRSAALQVPRNRIVTETDAPYMTPEPMRGMECSPEHTIFTAERLAAVFSCEPGEDRRQFLAEVYQNALDLLGREPTAWQGKAPGKVPGAVPCV
jgi:TatD DNase family protein